jgi:hypothetical protein
LPIDHQFGLNDDSCPDLSYNDYIEELKEKLEESYKIASSKISKAQGAAKERYDRRVRGNKLECGDRVLVRKTKFQEGKHKLANRWEDKVYTVIKQLEGIPVFELKPEKGPGRSRRLHRNNILPISSKKDKANQPKSSSSSDSSESEFENLPRGFYDVVQNQESEISDESDHEVESEGEDVNERTTPEVTTPESDKPPTPREEAQPTLPRRSGRERQPPVRFQSGDYILNYSAQIPQDQKIQLLNKMFDFLK